MTTTDSLNGGSSEDLHSYRLPSTVISASLLSSSKSLRNRDLVGQHDRGVNAVEFSDDGSFFVSGGDDGRVVLWPKDKVIDKQWAPEATAMDTKHGGIAFSLAVSPDNERILSGGIKDKKLLIHDVKT